MAHDEACGRSSAFLPPRGGLICVNAWGILCVALICVNPSPQPSL